MVAFRQKHNIFAILFLFEVAQESVVEHRLVHHVKPHDHCVLEEDALAFGWHVCLILVAGLHVGLLHALGRLRRLVIYLQQVFIIFDSLLLQLLAETVQILGYLFFVVIKPQSECRLELSFEVEWLLFRLRLDVWPIHADEDAVVVSATVSDNVAEFLVNLFLGEL